MDLNLSGNENHLLHLQLNGSLLKIFQANFNSWKNHILKFLSLGFFFQSALMCSTEESCRGMATMWRIFQKIARWLNLYETYKKYSSLHALSAIFYGFWEIDFWIDPKFGGNWMSVIENFGDNQFWRIWEFDYCVSDIIGIMSDPLR